MNFEELFISELQNQGYSLADALRIGSDFLGTPLSAQWEESKHKRDENGQFTSTGSTKPTKKPKDYSHVPGWSETGKTDPKFVTSKRLEQIRREIRSIKNHPVRSVDGMSRAEYDAYVQQTSKPKVLTSEEKARLIQLKRQEAEEVRKAKNRKRRSLETTQDRKDRYEELLLEREEAEHFAQRYEGNEKLHARYEERVKELDEELDMLEDKLGID